MGGRGGRRPSPGDGGRGGSARRRGAPRGFAPGASRWHSIVTARARTAPVFRGGEILAAGAPTRQRRTTLVHCGKREGRQTTQGAWARTAASLAVGLATVAAGAAVPARQVLGRGLRRAEAAVARLGLAVVVLAATQVALPAAAAVRGGPVGARVRS
jgi:hypothetical protein